MGYKVSVIIPTLQIYPKLTHRLLQVLKCDSVVDEIIIINNAQKPLPHEMLGRKIRVLNQQENLFVNASWNLGIEEAKNERFLIINDDILCCENYCTKIINSGILEKPDTGLVGISPPGNIKELNPEDILKAKEIKAPDKVNFNVLPPNQYLEVAQWGCAYMGKKSNYYKIPEDLKIYLGDSYLLKLNVDNGKVNYAVDGFTFLHSRFLQLNRKIFIGFLYSDFIAGNKYFSEIDENGYVIV